MTARLARSYPDLRLLPQHEKLLADSAIQPHVATARRYESATTKARLKELGLSESQRRVPALVIPVYAVATGEIALYQARPDDPRRDPRGRPIKYETPRGARMALDCNPMMRSRLKDPSVPLFITEGARKADAAVGHGLCTIALLGVWNFRGRNEFGGLTVLSDWDSIALKERKGYIVYDSDVMEKPEVSQALARLKAFLEDRGARVRVIYLPSGVGGVKVGLDDYLAARHTVEDLLGLATSELRGHEDDREDARYRATPAGLRWVRRTPEGDVVVPLTNFEARIVAQQVFDDGVETRCDFDIEAHLGDRARRVTVPAEEFACMGWVLRSLGACAIVSAGTTIRDRAREAIQSVSGAIPERRVFAHTGWRNIAGQPVYLHGGGAIGPAGCLADIDVRLPPALARFVLPAPPDEGDELRDALRASLELLEIGPDIVMVPLLAAAYRAPLGAATDFALHVTGETGTMKTTLAALVQQHFGAGMDASGLPGHWSSTANALEEVAFGAKDAVLVVDDFAPSGSAQDVRRLHREAERVFRAQGNQAGRQRMRRDTTLRPERPPRALIVSTGEEVPRGSSVRARMLIMELPRGAVDRERLTACQQAAEAGAYARATAGYVRWLAAHYTEVCEALPDQVRDISAAVQPSLSRTHPRISWTIAHLLAGMSAFLAFAVDVGAVSDDEAERLWQRAWEALFAAGAAQGAHQADADPVVRFGQLLCAVLESGQAHVAGADRTSVPDGDAADLGWRAISDSKPQPQGLRIGWVEGDEVFLNPDAAYAAVQRLAEVQGEPLGVDRGTLARRLRDRGVLASAEGKHLGIKRTFDGRRGRVWRLDFPKILGLSSVQQVGQVGRPSAVLENQGVALAPPAPPLQETRWGRVVWRPTGAPGSAAAEGGPGRCPTEPVGQVGQRESLSIKGSGANAPPAPPVSTKGEQDFLEDGRPLDVPDEPCWTCGGRAWSITPDGRQMCDVCHPDPGAVRRDGGGMPR